MDPLALRHMSIADLLEAAADAFEDDYSVADACDKIEAARASLAEYHDAEDVEAEIEHVDDADSALDDAEVALNGWITRVDAIVAELRERSKNLRAAGT